MDESLICDDMEDQDPTYSLAEGARNNPTERPVMQTSLPTENMYSVLVDEYSDENTAGSSSEEDICQTEDTWVKQGAIPKQARKTMNNNRKPKSPRHNIQTHSPTKQAKRKGKDNKQSEGKGLVSPSRTCQNATQLNNRLDQRSSSVLKDNHGSLRNPPEPARTYISVAQPATHKDNATAQQAQFPLYSTVLKQSTQQAKVNIDQSNVHTNPTHLKPPSYESAQKLRENPAAYFHHLHMNGASNGMSPSPQVETLNVSQDFRHGQSKETLSIMIHRAATQATHLLTTPTSNLGIMLALLQSHLHAINQLSLLLMQLSGTAVPSHTAHQLPSWQKAYK